MFEFALHPNIYATGVDRGLRPFLEKLWIQKSLLGKGTIYLISGFANFNGGARFYGYFEEHIRNGGEIVAIFGGSRSQRLASKQVVEAFLDCGARVYLINRKRILHAKCYGYKFGRFEELVISSGNFTGSGLSQNIEASVYINKDMMKASNFSWKNLMKNMLASSWQIHECKRKSPQAPFWDLLYDELGKAQEVDSSELQTMILTLQPTDTNRILAKKGEKAGQGSQYFWLSKDCFDFFPALTIKNKRGWKGTLSAKINLNYIDLKKVREERVTFEAENNLDFRLGTGALRYQKLASPGDLACITRVSDSDYELRIIGKKESKFATIDKYATHFIGHQGKRYGFVDNSIFQKFISAP